MEAVWGWRRAMGRKGNGHGGDYRIGSGLQRGDGVRVNGWC